MWRLNKAPSLFPQVVCVLLLPASVVMQFEWSSNNTTNNAANDNHSLVDTIQSSTQSTAMHDVNVIVLLAANDTTFESIYKYLQWTVHDQKLLPANYQLKLGRVSVAHECGPHRFYSKVTCLDRDGFSSLRDMIDIQFKILSQPAAVHLIVGPHCSPGRTAVCPVWQQSTPCSTGHTICPHSHRHDPDRAIGRQVQRAHHRL